MVSDLLTQGAADLAETADRLLADLDREVAGAAGLRGECRPALDVLETADSVEIVMDLPGVPASAVRVAIRRSSVVIVGAKMAPSSEGPSRFHLAERSYGRFARVVRIGGAVDAGRARATAGSGVLRIVLPRVAEQRGRVFEIPVERG